jgi:mono/diheme cytochrome c family protein
MIRFRPIRHALLALACALPPAASAADAERGRSLYESRCDNCHTESVHGRAKREASGFESLRGWVRRWSGNLGLKWTDEEIDDVTVYLNGRYYRFACPPSACKATGQADGAFRFARAAPKGAP